MNHSDIQALMADYLEGDLSLEKRALFDGHLDGCEACASELGEMRRTISLLRALPTPEPPPDLVDNVLRRIREGEGQASWLDRVGGWLSELASPRIAVPVTALAAALAVALITGDLQLDLPGMPEQPQQVAAVPAPRPPGLTERPAADGLAVRPPAAAPPTRSRVPSAEATDPAIRIAGRPDATSRQPASGAGAGDAAGSAGGSPAAQAERGPFFVAQPSSRGDSRPVLDDGIGGLEEPRGLVVVSGPSASGKLTHEVGNPIPKDQRRLIELDGKLNYLLRDSVEFARWMGTLSVAEQELWLEELAERAEERGLVEPATLALSESDDATGQSLATAFAAAAERNSPSNVVSPDTAPLPE